jgi:phage baseplate assembly protein W
MHTNHNAISGHCDGIEAVIQSIYKILNTERYQHIIYSWNYGFEFQDLLGKPVDYACVELQRRIQEALLQDDRITSVTDFKFDNSTKRTVKVTFVVHTIYGDVESERKVVI